MVFLLNLGGDDGLRKSNTYTLEKNYNWNGIVIEACEKMYKKCLTTRKCIILNECVYLDNSVIDFLDADGGPSGILGFDNKFKDGEVIDRVGRVYKPDLERTLILVKKTTKTLDDILTKNNAPINIDYLSLDTEGTEYAILKNFPFNKWKIKILSIERPSYELKKLLEFNKYIEICKLGQDVMFLLNN